MAKKIFNGLLRDTSATVDAAIKKATRMWLANVYMIGKPSDANVLMLTDWEGPLLWSPFGVFVQGVTGRSSVSMKVGLEVDTFTFSYSPRNRSFLPNVNQTSPIKLAYEGYYDNKDFRMWRVFMPTKGDADTWGAMPMFGGRITGASTTPTTIDFTVTSFLDVINQKVPSNVIENTNVIASFAGAKPPAGFATIPQFSVFAGSTNDVLYLDCTNFAGHIFDTNLLRGGWLMWNTAAGNTLGGFFSIIGANKDYIDGSFHHHNLVQMISAFPWPPTPGVDTCFISAPIK